MARGPARFVAPLALVAFGVALFLVLSTALKDDPGTADKGAQPSSQGTGKNAKKKKAKKKKKAAKTYTVKAGDTPSGIAEKVDVPLDTLLQLNPDLDPQILTPGQKLKLR
jgi:LysM repeat protein